MLLLSLILAGALSGCASAPRTFCVPPREPYDLASARRLLTKAPSFQSDGIGIAGAPSCYAAAYRVLVEQPDAPDLFRSLYRHGTPEARIYALVGLHTVDPESFRELRTDPWVAKAPPIRTQFGCSGGQEQATVLVQAITDGKFDTLL
jgi:hypothetical protein